MILLDQARIQGTGCTGINLYFIIFGTGKHSWLPVVKFWQKFYFLVGAPRAGNDFYQVNTVSRRVRRVEAVSSSLGGPAKL